MLLQHLSKGTVMGMEKARIETVFSVVMEVPETQLPYAVELLLQSPIPTSWAVTSEPPTEKGRRVLRLSQNSYRWLSQRLATGGDEISTAVTRG